jgi:hypothetical protein
LIDFGFVTIPTHHRPHHRTTALLLLLLLVGAAGSEYLGAFERDLGMFPRNTPGAIFLKGDFSSSVTIEAWIHSAIRPQHSNMTDSKMLLVATIHTCDQKVV